MENILILLVGQAIGFLVGAMFVMSKKVSNDRSE